MATVGEQRAALAAASVHIQDFQQMAIAGVEEHLNEALLMLAAAGNAGPEIQRVAGLKDQINQVVADASGICESLAEKYSRL